MTDAERYKLHFGPYQAPLFEYGEAMDCAIYGGVIACGLSKGRIPWPIGKRPRSQGRFLIVTGDLERAIQQEANIAVSHWWGVSEGLVCKWRRHLGFGAMTEGTRRLRREYTLEPAGQEALEKAIARAREPDVRAKMGATRRGRPLHPDTFRKSAEARKGKPLSEEHRRKIKEALHALGDRAPWVATAWRPEEDALLLQGLSDEEVARRTGRSLNGVGCRRRRLLGKLGQGGNL
jgi:nucleotide-binding universal stress UspA family protein